MTFLRTICFTCNPTLPSIRVQPVSLIQKNRNLQSNGHDESVNSEPQLSDHHFGGSELNAEAAANVVEFGPKSETLRFADDSDVDTESETRSIMFIIKIYLNAFFT